MADRTHIEWTDATWNPVTGCSVISPGCTNCYAMTLAGGRLRHVASREGLTTPSKAGPVWNGQVRFNEAELLKPLAWKRPRKIFVCAHGDLFHENVPDAWIDRVFAVMALAPQHTFQVLTKRAERMRDYVNNPDRIARIADALVPFSEMEGHPGRRATRADIIGCDAWAAAGNLIAGHKAWPLNNLWLGVSAEDQPRLDERVAFLVDTLAAIHFLSIEPQLGPVDLERVDLRPTHPHLPETYRYDCLRAGSWTIDTGRFVNHSDMWGRTIDWVIAGGESGRGARAAHPDWFRSLRDQCEAARVAFFFKQWGEWHPWPRSEAIGVPDGYVNPAGRFAKWPRPDGFGEHGPYWLEANGFANVARIGKRDAGRDLDGRTHDAFPATAP